MVPGSTTELNLKQSGDYEIITSGFDGRSSRVSYTEKGVWKSDTFAIILEPIPERKDLDLCLVLSRRLFALQNEDGTILLVSRPEFSPPDPNGRIRFRVMFERVPNQSVDSTRSAGTSAAEQPRVPASAASHL